MEYGNLICDSTHKTAVRELFNSFLISSSTNDKDMLSKEFEAWMLEEEDGFIPGMMKSEAYKKYTDREWFKGKTITCQHFVDAKLTPGQMLCILREIKGKVKIKLTKEEIEKLLFPMINHKDSDLIEDIRKKLLKAIA